jgi:hypothetical protein
LRDLDRISAFCQRADADGVHLFLNVLLLDGIRVAFCQTAEHPAFDRRFDLVRERVINERRHHQHFSLAGMRSTGGPQRQGNGKADGSSHEPLL